MTAQDSVCPSHCSDAAITGRCSRITNELRDRGAARAIRPKPTTRSTDHPKTSRSSSPTPRSARCSKAETGSCSNCTRASARTGKTAITSKALYGLGGIGKTRAAVEYAWAHRDEYTALLFVVADTPEALRPNLAALATTLVPDLDPTDDTAQLRAVLAWLRSNPGWFLILDNLDTREALTLADSLLAELSGGHLVITSRLAHFSANFEPLALDVLTIDDAVAFLLDRTNGRRRNTKNDNATVREVAVELGRLALALEQAGAYIARHRLTFDGYLERWSSAQHDSILSWFDKDTMTGYPKSVAVTWQTSVAQLTEAGRHLLERLSCLAPEKVPESLLNVPIPGAETENLNEALADLSAYSLVMPDAEGPFFLVHRLIQDVTRSSLADGVRRLRLTEALGWIEAAFPDEPDKVRSWPEANQLAPHARVVSSEADGTLTARPGLLLNSLAELYRAQGRYSDAQLFYERSLAVREKILGPDHPDIATSLSDLGGLYNAQGRSPEALSLQLRALSIREKVFPSDPAAVANSLNNLAEVYRSQGLFKDAEPLHRRSLAMREKIYGKSDPKVAISLTNLAHVFRAQGRLVEAKSFCQRALDIREQAFGPDDPTVGASLNNLARVYYAQKRFLEAEQLYRSSLAIRETTLGKDHPDVGASLNNLAQLYREQGRYADAESHYRRGLAILVTMSRQIGRAHPYLERGIQNYMKLLAQMGKSEVEVDAERQRLMHWQA